MPYKTVGISYDVYDIARSDIQNTVVWYVMPRTLADKCLSTNHYTMLFTGACGIVYKKNINLVLSYDLISLLIWPPFEGSRNTAT
jgi:hypothetical protein